MARNGRSRIGPLVVAAGLAWLAGCRHPAGPPVGNALLEGASGRGDLTPRQLADVQVAYGQALEKRGEADQARARYFEAVKHDPDRADAWRRLAVLHDRQGKFSEAAEMYHRALALRPGDPDLFCDVGYSFYLQQRWAEAEMNLRQAIALRPEHARARNNLGLLLARTGQDDAALAEFRKAGCTEADARVNVAFGLTLESRWADARRHYREALAADGSCLAAKKGLENLEAVLAKAPLRDAESSARPDGEVVPATHWRADEPGPKK
jgi:Tfp pilus assembly protein PilF